MNEKLADIYEADQKERLSWKEWGKSIAFEDVKSRDSERLNIVLSMIEKSQLKEGVDYYHAAMVLQHSAVLEHYKLANDLCQKAIELGEKRAKWLYAATLDRFLMNSGEKFQKFGTQYKKNAKGLWEQYPVDPQTTDADREHYNVPSLENLKKHEQTLNEGIN